MLVAILKQLNLEKHHISETHTVQLEQQQKSSTIRRDPTPIKHFGLISYIFWFIIL
jgi:hypothetical protein